MGVITSAVTEAVMAPNAAPIMTATARSTTLPRRIKSRNPFSISSSRTWFGVDSRGKGNKEIYGLGKPEVGTRLRLVCSPSYRLAAQGFCSCYTERVKDSTYSYLPDLAHPSAISATIAARIIRLV